MITTVYLDGLSQIEVHADVYEGSYICTLSPLDCFPVLHMANSHNMYYVLTAVRLFMCIYQLENKKDAFSIELQQYCLSQPVCVIRGLAGALKLGKDF